MVIIYPILGHNLPHNEPPQTVGTVESLSKHTGWALYTPGFMFYPDGKRKIIFGAKNEYIVKLEKCLDNLFFHGFGIIDLILIFFILEIEKNTENTSILLTTYERDFNLGVLKPPWEAFNFYP